MGCLSQQGRVARTVYWANMGHQRQSILRDGKSAQSILQAWKCYQTRFECTMEVKSQRNPSNGRDQTQGTLVRGTEEGALLRCELSGMTSRSLTAQWTDSHGQLYPNLHRLEIAVCKGLTCSRLCSAGVLTAEPRKSRPKARASSGLPLLICTFCMLPFQAVLKVIQLQLNNITAALLHELRKYGNFYLSPCMLFL